MVSSDQEPVRFDPENGLKGCLPADSGRGSTRVAPDPGSGLGDLAGVRPPGWFVCSPPSAFSGPVSALLVS